MAAGPPIRLVASQSVPRVGRLKCTSRWREIPALRAGSFALWSHRRVGVPGTPLDPAGGAIMGWRRVERQTPEGRLCKTKPIRRGEVVTCSGEHGEGYQRNASRRHYEQKTSRKTKPICGSGATIADWRLRIAD
jgi:hypothetical protein